MFSLKNNILSCEIDTNEISLDTILIVYLLKLIEIKLSFFFHVERRKEATIYNWDSKNVNERYYIFRNLFSFHYYSYSPNAHISDFLFISECCIKLPSFTPTYL